MRFQLGTGAVYPTPPPAFRTVSAFLTGIPPDTSLAVNTDLQWESFNGPSGESGIIIPGAGGQEGITLTQIVASWGSLETAGRLEVSSNPDKALLVLFQTAPSGVQTIPLSDLPLIISSYGLRCDNNSVGGEYNVTVFFRHTT